MGRRSCRRWGDVIVAQHTSVTLEDINGDGLPDYVDARESIDVPRGIRVLFNTGAGFERLIPGTYPGARIGFGAGYDLEWFDEDQQWQDRVLGSDTLTRGYSRSTWRRVDLDADGLVDLVRLPEPQPDTTANARPYTSGVAQWTPEVYFNVGDQLVLASNPPIQNIWRALARIRVTDNASTLQGTWQVLTDFVDLDGDGLPEAVNNDQYPNNCNLLAGEWQCNMNNNALTDPDDGRAPRALRTIRNGRGAEIQFDYDAVKTATGRVPHPVWAVTKMTVSPGLDADGVNQAPMITQYAYDHAEYNADLDDQWGFRGFGVVQVTSPGGARTVTTRDFSQDHAGLVVEQRVYDRPTDPTHAASITTYQYEDRRLFPTVPPIGIISHHLTEELERICGATQDETTCASSGTMKRTTHTWESLPLGSATPMVHVRFASETSPGFGPTEGAIYRNTTRSLIHEPGKYWINDDVNREAWFHDGQYVDLGNTHRYYDPSNRVEISTAVLFDAQFNGAVTNRTFDMTTGNLETVKQPRYHGYGGPVTTYGYDAMKVFVARTTNQLGHIVDTVTDPATGVVLESRGPNTAMSQRDGWTKTIDGLGRVTAEAAWIDDASAGYKLEPSVRYTYVDTPGVGLATWIERRLEVGSVWTKQHVVTDGLGRTVRSTDYNSTAGQEGVSRSYFDAAGNLVLSRIPHPNTTTQTYVDWKYSYDALGRLVAAREPTRTGCTGEIGSTSWCGKRWSYDGLTVEEEDVVGTAGGQVGRTRSRGDFLGRLVQVDELQTSGAWATTTYEHDGSGNVLRTTSADSVVTASTFDYADRRRTSTRGGKTWVFGYDNDGNLTSVQAPVPAGDAVEDHITTIAYDELGRITSEVGAVRGLSTAERSMLGEPIVTRTYDLGVNGVGRLSRVEQDVGSIDYAYDAQGRVIGESHGFSIWNNDFHDQRQIARTYGLQGQLLSLTAADATTPAAATRITYLYDGRLQPVASYWWDGSTYKGTIESVAYNPSGRGYQRNFAVGTTTYARGTTQWDPAGRVSSVQVQSRRPGTTSLSQRVLQTFTFDGAADVSAMSTFLSATSSGSTHQAAFGYDRMHRLVSATGPRSYTGSFGYSSGGRLTAANVNAATSAARVHRRNVTYVYGPEGGDLDADPDAPVRLNTVGGGTWMSMNYDVFGNAIERSQGGAVFTHIYDGFDRQRGVGLPDGSFELYWYGPDGQRSIVLTMGATGQVSRVRWIVGETEIWYGPTGAVDKQVAHASLGAATARIEDHARRELLYNDPRGNLLAVVGEDGALKAGFRYGPYGEMLEQIGPEQAEHLRRFNGKEHDALSGLSYYGFRYFDERTLAWTQADPKYRATVEKAGGQPRRASLYAFSLGNPVSMVDPDGAEPIDFANMPRANIPPKREVKGGPLQSAPMKAFKVGTWLSSKYDLSGMKAQERAKHDMQELRFIRYMQVQDAVTKLITAEMDRRQAANPHLNIDLTKDATARIHKVVSGVLSAGRAYDGCKSHCYNTNQQEGSGDRNVDGSLNYVVDDIDRMRAIEAAAAVIGEDSLWTEELPGESYPDDHPRTSEPTHPSTPAPDPEDPSSPQP